MNLLTKKALDEYNGEIAKHHGGINGRPFWNTNSSQFIYNPCFGFPIIPGAKSYLFTANDCNGVTRSFKAEKPTSLLTPIWKDLPAGIVELKVEALDEDGNIKYLAGARTFFKCDPFPGRENLPPKACTYRECALKGLRYVYSHSMVKYLLEHEKPDPDYDYNAYPSKTLGSLISAMIAYSKLEPENSKNALKIATIAADYLISITYREDSHLAGLPPTYSTDFCDDDKKYDTYVAVERVGKVMMVYPPNVAKSYLELEEITGEKRFFDAALKIAQYYERNIQPNGSWYLFVSEETGKAENENYCVPCSIIELMHLMYEKTNDTKWLELEEKGYQYIERNCIETYNWEGQFEDAGFSNNYSNLTHFAANNIVRYITKTKAEEDLEKEGVLCIKKYF